jgi:hypothetical protein
MMTHSRIAQLRHAGPRVFAAREGVVCPGVRDIGDVRRRERIAGLRDDIGGVGTFQSRADAMQRRRAH